MTTLLVFTLVPDHSLRSGQIAIPKESISKIESGWEPNTMIVNGHTVYGDFDTFTRIHWRGRVVVESNAQVA